MFPDTLVNNRLREFSKNLCEAWVDRDETILKKIWDEQSLNPNLQEKLFGERDTLMANNIHKALNQQIEKEMSFFAIGLFHLFLNDDNVVNQRRDKGSVIDKV